FGLHLEKTPGPFLERMIALWDVRATVDPATVALAAGSLLVLTLMARFVKRIPGAIVVLLIATVLTTALGLHVDTIGSRFGGIPHVQFPKPHLELIPGLIGPAITVAMLGAIESLMSAVVADRMTRDKHNPNVELVAQGIANVFTPIVGGLPATGAIARTATNI